MNHCLQSARILASMSLSYPNPGSSGKPMFTPSTKDSQALLTLALLTQALLTQAEDEGVHLVVLPWQLVS